MELYQTLKNYQDNGVVKFESVLQIPLTDRIQGLVKQYGDKQIHGIVTVMLTDFCNAFNVVRPMTAEQITQCAYEIIMSSEEDYLSIEDIALFFQGAKQGKFGKPVFDRLDQQTIFVMLEAYREERHRQYMRIKEEKENSIKSFGIVNRQSESMNPQDARLNRSADNLAGAMGHLKHMFSETMDQGKKKPSAERFSEDEGITP